MSTRRCQQVAGFILEQECKQPADAFCNECSKPVCKNHSRVIDERILCLDCAKFYLQRNPNTMIGSRAPGTYYYDDDPYFYSYRYYPTYHFGSEFDETDRKSFDRQEQGGGEFEQDFGGS